MRLSNRREGKKRAQFGDQRYPAHTTQANKKKLGKRSNYLRVMQMTQQCLNDIDMETNKGRDFLYNAHIRPDSLAYKLRSKDFVKISSYPSPQRIPYHSQVHPPPPCSPIHHQHYTAIWNRHEQPLWRSKLCRHDNTKKVQFLTGRCR